jgi:hypothetical protein
MDAAPRPTLPLLDALNAVTRDLSKFAGSAAGLGSVLGGALCLVAYLAHGLLPAPLPPAARLTFAAFPLAWIAVKETLRRRYYQRFGLAVPPVPRTDRAVGIFCLIVTCAVSAGVTATVLAVNRPWTVERVGYLAFVLLLPPCALLFRSAEEFIVGVFLLCQAAVCVAGHRYAFTETYTILFPIASVGLIAAGVHQHRLFLAARKRLLDLRARLPQEAA